MPMTNPARRILVATLFALAGTFAYVAPTQAGKAHYGVHADRKVAEARAIAKAKWTAKRKKTCFKQPRCKYNAHRGQWVCIAVSANHKGSCRKLERWSAALCMNIHEGQPGQSPDVTWGLCAPQQ